MEGHRYVVVCLNEEEMRKDAHDRQAILESLQEALKGGDKSLVGNKGFRRFLKTERGSHFAIDEKQVVADRRYDGIFVLRTDTRILRELQTIRLGQISVGKPGTPVLARLTKVPVHLNALLAKLKLLPLFAAPPKWAAFPAEPQP